MADALGVINDRNGAEVETPDAPQRGLRGLRGFYPRSHRGRVAIDGSLLDRVVGDYAIASAWRSPSCEILACFRPEVGRMVPPLWRRCPRHGLPKLPLIDPYEMDGDELVRARERAWDFLAPKAGVPYPHRSYSFESSEATAAIEVAVDYREGVYICGCVLIYGRPGCGKTRALRAAFRDAVLDKARFDSSDLIVWFDFPQLVRSLLNPDERRATLQSCIEADDLYVDDLGSSHFRAETMVAGLVEEIFVEREKADLPMFASTNFAPRKFRAAFGERVFDRLRGEWGHFLDVDGPSLRRKREDVE